MYPRHTQGPRHTSPGSGNSRFGKSSFGGSRFSSSSRGASRGPSKGFQRGGGRKFGEFSDVSKFVNKAVITETVEKFVSEHKFADFLIDERLKQNIITKGYVMPTPIQDRAIPHVLLGRDVVGIANTGTGKTAAFLIPLINKILKNPREGVLIMVPTRELAIQIDEELKGFIKGFKIFSVVCVGGASMSNQIRNLRYQNNFIIGTPGRLKDLVEQKYLHLEGFKTVVLDEADRMLDMGFINDMRFMMSKMSKERHTLFFSATMSREIEVLIKDFLKEPVSISVKTGDTAKNVDQDIVRTNGRHKVDVLHNLLAGSEFKKVLVFGRTKHGVEKLSKVLAERGIKAESIHGNKNLSKRRQALDLFKQSRVQVLVATDVAARGLDISDVSHVINFDLPSTYEDYVHRIGRTGRGDKKGKALTFIE
ncbi:MAG: DEAD/DEAH box helicase [Candidatus Taylorbacteria bacterium]|nr:DEAD/DEAH box helicase [Candidatus Taylorbacteria bacterium]